MRRITTFKGEATFDLNGQSFSITRNQDTSARVPDSYALTSRACPPNCIVPMTAATGVATFGELEVIAFLEGTVAQRQGLLIDARAPETFATGSIPGAVNVPHMTLDPTNRYRSDILRALGAVPKGEDTFTFENALSLVIYSDGPWSREAVATVSNLIEAGYPAEKLSFYRTGMQGWVQLGLSTHQTQTPG